MKKRGSDAFHDVNKQGGSTLLIGHVKMLLSLLRD